MAPAKIVSGTDKDAYYAKLVKDVRGVFDSGKTLSLSYRDTQLRNLLRMTNECKDEFLTALHKDMRKSKFEACTYELEQLQNELRGAIRELPSWAEKEKVPWNLLLAFDRAFFLHEPYGTVLIIGAWNFPLLLLLQPLVGAIAAGNSVIIKPSENAPNVSATVAKYLPQYLDSECYRVVEGDASETIALLNQKFDYIFATSSTCIGKSIMQAAAKNLTPVTLELGGKSPVYIDDSANVKLAAKRILWGKCINSGQTCIAPDYVLCSKKTENLFIQEAKKVLKGWYGENIKNSPDFMRIINDNHFKRLKTLINDTKGQVAYGSETDSSELFIEPTLVVDVKEDDVLMQQEIFGPILPFVTVGSKKEAYDFIKSRSKPLALYVFSKEQKVLDFFIENTSSGAVCCNDVVCQNAMDGLHFGGVGESGMGAYHGKFTYDTFTHKKSVVIRDFSSTGEAMTAIRYPPYTNTNMKSIAMALRYMRFFNYNPSVMKYLVTFLLARRG